MIQLFGFLPSILILLLLGGLVTLILEMLHTIIHIYKDGYRYRGRPLGHWADTDSKITSLGAVLQYDSGIGWGSILRTGELNEDGSGNNSVSNGVASDYFAIEVFNCRSYDIQSLLVQTSLGWEEIKVQSSSLQRKWNNFFCYCNKNILNYEIHLL